MSPKNIGGADLPIICSLKNATVRFGRVTALTDISFEMHKGERVALIGSNGSGKSSLLRVIHGLVKPSAGEVGVNSQARQAMVFQRPYMMRASAVANVALGLLIRGSPWSLARSQALVALQRVGLADIATRSAKTLSGGQQQRLAMARALVLAPDMLLLDEPTANLDPSAKREFEALLAEVTTHMTLVFASHNLGQVKRLATRVIYLEQGRIQADLPVADFFDDARPRRVFPSAHFVFGGEQV